ncbi:diaminopimelate epimerase [Spirochaetia bacterium]|nr:diaminopimelate epimerase [Spirochaetia bacterium]
MNYDIIVADPAGNITIFVLNPVKNRTEAAKMLMAEPNLRAEQVGFVIPPQHPDDLWRMEMMGGEFCGNATRSFGLYVAHTTGLTGNATVTVAVSGASQALNVQVDTIKNRASVAIPPPSARKEIEWNGNFLPVYECEGISHVIASGIAPEAGNFWSIKELFEKCISVPAALGVMFYDCVKKCMKPAVYVYDTDTLIFESSCGSGSAAWGIWQCKDRSDGNFNSTIVQPGGSIEVTVVKNANRPVAVSIGGDILLKHLIWQGRVS